MKCEYCGSQLDETGGKMLVLSSGERIYFCSGKCEKNWEKKRSHSYGESD